MARSRALINVLNLAKKEELPIETQFLNDLKASIEIQDSKNSGKPSRTFKPSSMHCIRNMYFQVMGADINEGRMSSELVGICESGTDRHDRLQKAIMQMKENNIDCEYIDVEQYINIHKDELSDLVVLSKQGNETKLYHQKYNVRFLCDGIIRYKGKYYILEIKTESASKFWDRKDVSEDHILQGTAYSLLLNLSNVLFVYECRDTCNKKAFMFTPTKQQKFDLVNKIIACQDAIHYEVVPDKPSDVSKKACMYCPYSDLCKRLP